jgi:phosphopantetheinyl transferase
VNLLETPWPERVLVGSDVARDVARDVAKDVVSDAWFTPEELAHAATFKLEKRRQEWLLSRAVAKQFACSLGIADDPQHCSVARPNLLVNGGETGWYVSLSHSFPYAGAAIARHPIGLDVQVVREMSEDAAHLFLTEAETEAMLASRLEHRLLHFWCAKEAAWKRLGGRLATLKMVPVTLLSEADDAIVFDTVETRRIGDVIVAVTSASPLDR